MVIRRRQRGRPPLLNAKTVGGYIGKATAALQTCGYRHVAARACGITYETFLEWVKRGTYARERGWTRKDAVYLEFSDAVLDVENLVEMDCLGELRASKDWRARLAWLERRRPALYGLRTTVFQVRALLEFLEEVGDLRVDGVTSAAIGKLAKFKGLLGDRLKPDEIDDMLEAETVQRAMEEEGFPPERVSVALELLNAVQDHREVKRIEGRPIDGRPGDNGQ